MSVIEVRELDAAGGPRWDAFVESDASGTFFHLSDWRHVLADEFGCRCFYLYAERDGEIVGVLPLAQVRNLIAGNVLVSTPFLVYGGPIADDAEALATLVAEALRL